jgi:hypothetical protein
MTCYSRAGKSLLDLQLKKKKLAAKEIFIWNLWSSILELGTLQNNYNKAPGLYLTLTFALP